MASQCNQIYHQNKIHTSYKKRVINIQLLYITYRNNCKKKKKGFLLYLLVGWPPGLLRFLRDPLPTFLPSVTQTKVLRPSSFLTPRTSVQGLSLAHESNQPVWQNRRGEKKAREINCHFTLPLVPLSKRHICCPHAVLAQWLQ